MEQGGIVVEIANLKERVEKLEEKECKRADEQNIIQQAIVEIKLFSKITSETLAKLESRFEASQTKTGDNWFKLIEKMVLILAGIIGALLGSKII